MYDDLWRGASKSLVAALGMLVALAVVPSVAAGAQTGSGSGTTISAVSGTFGKMLVVGSGHYAGYTLYYLTSDAGGNYGCTTVATSTPVGRSPVPDPRGRKPNGRPSRPRGRPLPVPASSRTCSGQ